MAQPDFLKPLGLDSLAGAAAGGGGGGCTGGRTGVPATTGFILIPAAFAILRSSFSSRLRSFSLRRSSSSCELPNVTFCAACMSRKRALWWCAYELVCSSYCATFWNCLSQSSQ